MLNVSSRRCGAVMLLGLIALVSGLANAQVRLTKENRPGWVDKPLPGYYIGVSHRFPDEADSRADALNNAKRQIMESMGGIIESEFIDRIIESDGQVESVDAFTDSRIKVVSRNIITVKPEKTFTEQWQEGKGRKKKILYQTYVAVFFDEAAHRAFMLQMLHETCQLGEKQLNSASELAKKGQVFLAIDQIRSAEKQLQPLTEITGMAPEDLTAIKQLNEQMFSQIAALQNAVRLEVFGDRQTTKWGSALIEPLGLSVFLQEDSTRYPIPGLPVEFVLLTGKASFNPHTQTDAQGQAFCQVQEISSPGRVELEARVSFPEGYSIARKTLRLILLPENKAIICALETNLGNPVTMSYIQNLLMQNLTRAGFGMIENNPFASFTGAQIEHLNPADIQQTATDSGADLILLAAVSSDQPNRIQDGFYFARARGVLKVYNVKKQTIVGNYLIEDKNAGNSPENAGTKAIKKVSDALVQRFTSEIGL